MQAGLGGVLLKARTCSKGQNRPDPSHDGRALDEEGAAPRARTVAMHVDDVATALANAHVIEDEDLRRDRIFRARRALLKAEAAF
jgi:hypothetical protein